MKDWLIAHRGAQTEGRENTLKAFATVKNFLSGWVELDVHTTKDGVVICHHDFEVNGLDIDLCDFKALKKADHELTTFDEAIKAIGAIPLFVEIKPVGTAKNIINQIKQNQEWCIVSFKTSVIEELISLGVNKNRLYLLQYKHSFGHIKKAKRLGVGGIGVSQRLLTPSFYLRARLNSLNIYTYTVNSPLQAKLFRKLYPKLKICSDRVDLLQILK